jgi:hypothetical protein
MFPERASLFSFFGACVMFGWWLKSHQEAVAKVAKDGDFFSFHESYLANRWCKLKRLSVVKHINLSTL